MLQKIDTIFKKTIFLFLISSIFTLLCGGILWYFLSNKNILNEEQMDYISALFFLVGIAISIKYDYSNSSNTDETNSFSYMIILHTILYFLLIYQTHHFLVDSFFEATKIKSIDQILSHPNQRCFEIQHAQIDTTKIVFSIDSIEEVNRHKDNKMHYTLHLGSPILISKKDSTSTIFGYQSDYDYSHKISLIESDDDAYHRNFNKNLFIEQSIVDFKKNHQLSNIYLERLLPDSQEYENMQNSFSKINSEIKNRIFLKDIFVDKTQDTTDFFSYILMLIGFGYSGIFLISAGIAWVKNLTLKNKNNE